MRVVTFLRNPDPKPRRAIKQACGCPLNLVRHVLAATSIRRNGDGRIDFVLQNLVTTQTVTCMSILKTLILAYCGSISLEVEEALYFGKREKKKRGSIESIIMPCKYP